MCPLHSLPILCAASRRSYLKVFFTLPFFFKEKILYSFQKFECFRTIHSNYYDFGVNLLHTASQTVQFKEDVNL